jgi:hypothetical protein
MLEAAIGLLTTVAVIFVIGILTGSPRKVSSKEGREKQLAELRRKQEELTKAVEALTEKKAGLHGAQAAMYGSENAVFPTQSQTQNAPEAGSELASLGIGRA